VRRKSISVACDIVLMCANCKVCADNGPFQVENRAFLSDFSVDRKKEEKN